MRNTTRIFALVLAAAFFLVGVCILPFGIWVGDGPNPILGWVIFLLSVGIPWTIGVWLARIGIQKQNQ